MFLSVECRLMTKQHLFQRFWPQSVARIIYFLYHLMPRRDSNPRQSSCCRLGLLKDALLSELHHHLKILILNDFWEPRDSNPGQLCEKLPPCPSSLLGTNTLFHMLPATVSPSHKRWDESVATGHLCRRTSHTLKIIW